MSRSCVLKTGYSAVTSDRVWKELSVGVDVFVSQRERAFARMDRAPSFMVFGYPLLIVAVPSWQPCYNIRN